MTQTLTQTPTLKTSRRKTPPQSNLQIPKPLTSILTSKEKTQIKKAYAKARHQCQTFVTVPEFQRAKNLSIPADIRILKEFLHIERLVLRMRSLEHPTSTQRHHARAAILNLASAFAIDLQSLVSWPSTSNPLE